MYLDELLTLESAKRYLANYPIKREGDSLVFRKKDSALFVEDFSPGLEISLTHNRIITELVTLTASSDDLLVGVHSDFGNYFSKKYSSYDHDSYLTISPFFSTLSKLAQEVGEISSFSKFFVIDSQHKRNFRGILDAFAYAFNQEVEGMSSILLGRYLEDLPEGCSLKVSCR